jgi:hypothetical protein
MGTLRRQVPAGAVRSCAAAVVSPESGELIGMRCDALYNTLLHCISQSRPQAAGGVPPTMQSTTFDAR